MLITNNEIRLDPRQGTRVSNAVSKLKVVMTFLVTVLLLVSCSRDPQKAKARYLALGQNYMKKGQYGDAAIEFKNALRYDPRSSEVSYQLARADLARRDWSAAYDSLQKTIALDPTRQDARFDRAGLYLATRQFGKAENEANFILRQSPQNAAGYQLLGAALMGEQKPDEALAAFSKVTELRSNDSSPYLSMALTEISLHRPRDAEQHLKKAFTVDPTAIRPYAALIYSRIESPKPSKSCKLVLRRIEMGLSCISIWHRSSSVTAGKMTPRFFSINCASSFRIPLMLRLPWATFIFRESEPLKH